MPCRQVQNENSLIPGGDGFAKRRKKSHGKIHEESAMAKGQMRSTKEKKKPKAETSKKGTSSYKQAYGGGKAPSGSGGKS
jgi:hypothetical protein